LTKIDRQKAANEKNKKSKLEKEPNTKRSGEKKRVIAVKKKKKEKYDTTKFGAAVRAKKFKTMLLPTVNISNCSKGENISRNKE
jgi:hypothetical protein